MSPRKVLKRYDEGGVRKWQVLIGPNAQPWRVILGKRGGAWVFKGTRTPVSTVFENIEDMSVDELVEEFGVTPEQIHAS
jgi:hypothetical protein